METGPGRLPHRDLLLAAVLAAAMAVAALTTSAVGPLPRVGATVAAVGLLGLALRRRHPLTVTVVVAAVIVTEVVPAPEGSQAPAFLALMVAAYSLGVYARGAALVAGLAIGTAGVAAAQLLAPPAGYSHLSAISFFGAVLMAAPAAVGLLVRARRSVAARLRWSTASMRAGAADRIAGERTRQRDRLGGDIERLVLSGLERMRPHAGVRDLADVVALRDQGREVLGRLRALLGQLRHAEEEPEASREPGQGLAQLRDEVERVLAAGTGAGVPPRIRHTRWTLLDGARLDLLLAVAAGLYALLVISAYLSGPRPLLVCAAGTLAVLPLAASRRRPISAATVSAVATLAFTAAAAPADPLAGWVIAAPLIAFPVATGAFAGRRMAPLGLAVCVAAALLASTVDGNGRASWAEVVSSTALAVGGWIAGRALAATAAALAADAHAATLEHERHHDAVRAALDTDRARVARELHDAVGHAMTAVVLQATAAARVWDADPALAAGHVDTLRGSVSEALEGLRPLVATVAIDGGYTPGMAGIPGLVERARACGLDVHTDAVPGGVDPARDAVAYRIVQEALTNAARYAPGARVSLRLCVAAGTIDVQVDNDRPPYRPVESAGAGHGLRGMAERAGDCGGTLEAGPTPDGGFRVHATLPAAASLDGALA